MCFVVKSDFPILYTFVHDLMRIIFQIAKVGWRSAQKANDDRSASPSLNYCLAFVKFREEIDRTIFPPAAEIPLSLLSLCLCLSLCTV